MRLRTCTAISLLILALTACGDLEQSPPADSVEFAVDEPETNALPTTTIRLPIDPSTGALSPIDIENAVHSQAAADFASTTGANAVGSVRCLTGGPPLVYPASTLCHVTIGDVADELTVTYEVVVTDNHGRIAVARQ